MNFHFATLLLLAAADVAPPGDVWPGFRGRGDSISSATQLPVTWSEKDNVAWKVALPGYGQSSPVVWKERVFVTAAAGSQREKGFVLAYDVRTGKEAWRHAFEPTQKAKWSFSVSKAAPTPVVDADAVYTFFEGGDLLALTHDGKLLWSRSLVTEYGEFQNGHGLGGSPILAGDALIVLVDDRGPSYLLAVDRRTGKNLWKKDRPARGSWTSPTLATHGGRTDLIISSNGTVAAYDPKNGEQLWEMEGLAGNTVPSATVAGDRVVIGASAGRMGGDPQAAARSNLCLVLTDEKGKPGYRVAWTADKATATFASPLVYRGHAYFVSQAGVAFCIDLATGKERYAERIDGSCWASPVGAGDHVYFFGKDGVTTVVKAGPTFEKVASNRLWDAGDRSTKAEAPYASGAPILYGVAAVNGAFFVRSGSTLYRIGN